MLLAAQRAPRGHGAQLFGDGCPVADPVMGEFIRDNVPLFLIENDDVGLLGARIRAERLLRFEDGGSCRVLG